MNIIKMRKIFMIMEIRFRTKKMKMKIMKIMKSSKI